MILRVIIFTSCLAFLLTSIKHSDEGTILETRIIKRILKRKMIDDVLFSLNNRKRNVKSSK